MFPRRSDPFTIVSSQARNTSQLLQEQEDRFQREMMWEFIAGLVVIGATLALAYCMLFLERI
jgi:hypothetical protein